MEILQYLIALLPVAVWAFYIYKKDSLAPEPINMLWAAFRVGIFSCLVAIVFAFALETIGLYTSEPTTIWGAIRLSFFGAAIPEECAKLLMLWLLLRKNNYLNEWMDGIVYAVFISLGFAALENLLYVMNDENWVQVGIVRALFSIPGHFGFGILMGYYYSLVKLSLHHVRRNRFLMLAAPILAHGAYDSILFSIRINAALGGVLSFLFLYICHRLWKYGKKKIHEHLERDKEFYRLMEEKHGGD